MRDVGPRELLQEELAGLDALELADQAGRSSARRIWSATWPKMAAVAIALALWQLVVWLKWKPDYVLPGPDKVFPELLDQVADGTILSALRLTMERAAKGYAIALLIGVVAGSLVASNKVLRSAFGSFITGLQTMPSVAWVPLALLLFKISEGAVMFVVILGAAPSIANGLISGIDHIPPLQLRAGRAMGAKGLTLYRRIVLPAAFPGFVAGLKQGWAFAWRSLMAAELIVIVKGHQSIGVLMQTSRDLNDTVGLLAAMVLILVVGIVIDALVFGRLEQVVKRRWGLASTS
jgi:NitT/TauT family transport system permease protein